MRPHIWNIIIWQGCLASCISRMRVIWAGSYINFLWDFVFCSLDWFLKVTVNLGIKFSVFFISSNFFTDVLLGCSSMSMWISSNINYVWSRVFQYHYITFLIDNWVRRNTLRLLGWFRWNLWALSQGHFSWIRRCSCSFHNSLI